jgi:hypothetical protein
VRRKTRWQIATPTYAYEVAERTAKRREQRTAKGLILNEVSGPAETSSLARLEATYGPDSST